MKQFANIFTYYRPLLSVPGQHKKPIIYTHYEITASVSLIYANKAAVCFWFYSKHSRSLMGQSSVPRARVVERNILTFKLSRKQYWLDKFFL